ncbi:hypothetical protein I3843_03G004800 [Carya illinoinensis]|nr:hypothetical protein I3843_03G004800 [Carya illinoinensis]
MINSLCGSMGSGLKSEDSSTTPQPTSPDHESFSESKKTTTTTTAPHSDLEHNSLTPPSLNFPTLKFDLDGDVEVQSPDSSLWESFFADQLDGDFTISSPVRNLPSPQNSAYNYNHYYAQAMQVQSLSGYSPPRFSSQMGPFSSSQKGKGLSPLQRVFNSPKNQYTKPDTLSLSTIEDFLDDYQREEFGSYPTTKVLSGIGSSSRCFDMPTVVPAVDGLTMANSSRFCGSANETSTPGGSQLTQERDIYQIGSIAGAPLSQQLQHERSKRSNCSKSSHNHEHRNNTNRILTIIT